MKSTPFPHVHTIKQVDVKRLSLVCDWDGQRRPHMVFTYLADTTLGPYVAELPVLETELSHITPEKREALASALAQGEIDRREGRA